MHASEGFCIGAKGAFGSLCSALEGNSLRTTRSAGNTSSRGHLPRERFGRQHAENDAAASSQLPPQVNQADGTVRHAEGAVESVAKRQVILEYLEEVPPQGQRASSRLESRQSERRPPALPPRAPCSSRGVDPSHH